jgi:hypothetical protein
VVRIIGFNINTTRNRGVGRPESHRSGSSGRRRQVEVVPELNENNVASVEA